MQAVCVRHTRRHARGLNLDIVSSSQLLILQLALKLLRLCNLPHCLVEVILVDGIPVIFDRKKAPVLEVKTTCRQRK
jgi:hypothetical protein